MAAPTLSDNAIESYIRIYREIAARFGYSEAPHPGRLDFLGWDIEYLSPAALLSFIDQHLVRRLNDFVAGSDRPRILDCGANIGLSVLNYRRQYPGARIKAFEPDPDILPILKRNLTRNGAGDVEVVEAAVWTENGRAPWKNVGIVGSHLDEGAASGSHSVPTADLADHLAEPIDLLKIDIEGAEFQVVPRLADRLGAVKSLIVECHLGQARLVPFADMIRALKQAGFMVYLNPMGDWRDLLRQPAEIPEGVEQQIIVSASRGIPAGALTERSLLPLTGIAGEMRMRAERTRRSEAILAALRASLGIGKGRIFDRRLKKRFANEIGACWTAPLRRLEAASDDSADPARSQLLLFEDDALLGPAHTPHDDIRRLGDGRYSHWGSTLYFSTSDGTDPNANGRRYRVVCPVNDAS